MNTRFRPMQVIEKLVFWFLVLLIIFYTVFPFYWAIISSFKPRGELFATPVSYVPSSFNPTSYQTVLTAEFFLQGLRNSAIVSTVTVLIALAIGSFAAYALGRLNFRGRTIILYMILAMTLFPGIAILGSLFEMVRAAGIYNTYFALIFSYLIFTLPFTTWVLTNFFRSMPGELEEAALVDGASPLQTFWQVLMPLAAPGIVTTGMLAFISAWNEFLFALTFTLDFNTRTVPVAIAFFPASSQFEIPWGDIMAGSVIVTLPLIILVLVFQRRILAGLTAGAVKG